MKLPKGTRPLRPEEEVEVGDWVFCTREKPRGKWRRINDLDQWCIEHGAPQECCLVRRPQ